ncbi:carbohydrate ABC transporter permease [Microlunatus soli]|uniref:Multiple sugar transport system permease protein n=1 Tax=Microlunatus soli TaxID=630515 RepID=A0A1H1ZP84_9ACTN|nr:sugar ABC transporter permease [Microlunatus soli]SDT35528.1 multiple sugar transport system permease protein [Microlunatus soli]
MTATGDVAAPVSDPIAGRTSPGRRPHRMQKIEHRAGFAFLTPWLIGMAALTLGPMIYSLYLAFTDYNLLSSPQWVGLGNFRAMFADDRFISSVQVTLLYVVVSVPVVLIVSMLVALLLNTGLRFIKAYRALFYLPSLLAASVAVATLWRQIFGPSGLINNLLSLVGIHAQSWIGNPSTALGVIISLNAWAFGATMIIFLAGLRQVPSELYEAASVDGAGRLRKFVSITVPWISPLIFFNVLMDTVHAFQAFTSAYVVSGGSGGPSDSTLFYTLYLYQKGFTELNMGYASAMAWLLVIVLGVFTGLFFLSARFWVHYGDR